MKTGKTPNTKCRNCGKEFYVKPYFLEQSWGKYCSKKCKDESQKKGKFVFCSYCGKGIYRSHADLQKKSKTGCYFCNNSCHCAWKNRHRKKKKSKLLKHLWRPWCNGSTTRCGRVSEDSNSSGLQVAFFLKLLRFKRRKIKPSSLKRPPKKILYSLYRKKNYSQTEIAKIFNATHTSVRRWFIYYKIPVKPRSLSCGQNPNSRKNLQLGQTEESQKKSAETRRIYTKESLIQKIRQFTEQHGRIPTKREFVENPQYPDHVTYRDYFGTWNKAIRTAGFDPNTPMFASICYARDGHKCYSIGELIIDDWLFENGIAHLKEVRYPESGYRCDFLVSRTFIEFFGLANAFSSYDDKIEEKKTICKKYNIPLVEIYYQDLNKLNQIIGLRLGQSIRQQELLNQDKEPT